MRIGRRPTAVTGSHEMMWTREIGELQLTAPGDRT